MTTILVHGLFGSGQSMLRLAERLLAVDDRRRIVLPDLPGHGDSSPLAPGATLDDVAEALDSVIDEVDQDAPVDLVGHSLGGRVSLATLAQAPDRVRRVVLLDIAPGPTAGIGSLGVLLEAIAVAPDDFPDRGEAVEHLTSSGVARPLATALVLNLVGRRPVGNRDSSRPFGWVVDRQAIGALSRRVGAQNLWWVAETWPARIAAIRGEDSDFVSDGDAERMHSLGSRIDSVRGGDHFAHAQQPDRVAELLASALCGRRDTQTDTNRKEHDG